MELRQLEYFVAVAEEANFTRAAERVHISQSGVSAQVKQLERELGAVLIDRSGRTAGLTAAGRAALGHARAALASAESLRRAVDEVKGLIRGRIVVGTVPACPVTPLFDALSGFHRDHPEVEITLVEDASDRLLDRLGTGAADLVLTGCAGGPPAGHHSHTIISEPPVLAVPQDHPLAGLPRVTLADLAEHRLICMPRGTGVRTAFDEACARAGVRCTVELQASAPSAVADLVIRGLGAAVLTPSIADSHAPWLTWRRIEGADIPALLCLVWAGTDNPAVERLLDHCRRTFAEPPAESATPAADAGVTAG